jgi:hypothetical protein
MIARINVPINVEINMETNGTYLIKSQDYDDIYAYDDDFEQAIRGFKETFIEYIDTLVEWKNEGAKNDTQKE